MNWCHRSLRPPKASPQRLRNQFSMNQPLQVGDRVKRRNLVRNSLVDIVRVMIILRNRDDTSSALCLAIGDTVRDVPHVHETDPSVRRLDIWTLADDYVVI